MSNKTPKEKRAENAIAKCWGNSPVFGFWRQVIVEERRKRRKRKSREQ